MQDLLNISSAHRDETFALGQQLSKLLKEGDVVALYGELGSGKTVFIQGVCAGLGVDSYVTSPSFTLIQEYSGRLPVYHFDFYRLNSLSEIEDLGVDMYFDDSGIALVEWAERGEALLSASRYNIRFQHVEEGGVIMPDQRVLTISGPGSIDLSDLSA